MTTMSLQWKQQQQHRHNKLRAVSNSTTSQHLNYQSRHFNTTINTATTSSSRNNINRSRSSSSNNSATGEEAAVNADISSEAASWQQHDDLYGRPLELDYDLKTWYSYRNTSLPPTGRSPTEPSIEMLNKHQQQQQQQKQETQVPKIQRNSSFGDFVHGVAWSPLGDDNLGDDENSGRILNNFSPFEEDPKPMPDNPFPEKPTKLLAPVEDGGEKDACPKLYSYLLTEDKQRLLGPFHVEMSDEEEVYQMKQPQQQQQQQQPQAHMISDNQRYIVFSFNFSAAQQRFCRSTSQNPVSSRSHAIFSLGVESQIGAANSAVSRQQIDNDDDVVMVRRGKLTFVDLAGSERNSEMEEQQREASNINKGLLVLGKCIQALSRDEKGHVPYRDSKLTKVLSESLGGQSCTVMVIEKKTKRSQYSFPFVCFFLLDCLCFTFEGQFG